MKNLIIASFILIGSLAAAQNKVTVEITGLDNDNGIVMIGLYNSKQTFLKTSFKGTSTTVKDNKAIITFNNIPNGEYAVGFYHDANSNGKMDSYFFGLPKESYGASNNAKVFMGTPKYDDAKFFLNQDKVLKINN